MVLVAAALGLMFSSTTVSAQTTPVTIDSRSPTLERGDGESWTTSLGFTNLTDTQVTLEASAINATDTAPPKPDTSKPEWHALKAFPILLVALLVAAVIYLPATRQWPNKELKYLEATWSFKESWVSNVTVAGGLLAGIFGSSDVVTALLGKDAKSSVALATVGAAVAASVIAAAPLLLLATKSKDDFFTVGGFVFASAITLAAAAGELWVVYRSGQKLDLGGQEDKIVFLAVAGFVLLALYAIRAVPATIKHGTTAPPKPAPSDTIVAATWIVEALKAHTNINADRLGVAVGPIPSDFPKLGTSPAADSPRPRRSALL